jgi:hypothetical protein
MKKVKVLWNGKHLRDVYPHANWFQVLKWKVGKFFRKVVIVSIVVGLVYLTYIIIAEFNAVKYTAEPKVVQKTTEDELEKIMNEENFKKVTILRARKVASDNKMAEEKQKHEDIMNKEKTRHDSILAQIEAENEAIRAEELALVGKVDLQ